MAEADVAPWPTRAEQCGGRIGERWAAQERASEELGARTRLVQQYREELARHDRTIQAAAPGVDLLLLAAAVQGKAVYEKALAEASREMAHADESYRATAQRLAVEFSRFQSLQRQLTGRERIESGEGGTMRDRATLINELESLIGFRPGGL